MNTSKVISAAAVGTPTARCRRAVSGFPAHSKPILRDSYVSRKFSTVSQMYRMIYLSVRVSAAAGCLRSG